MKNIKFQIFGSKSSQDYDVLIFVDKLGSIQENHEMIDEYNNIVADILHDNHYEPKEMNCNLGVLNNGQIVEVFKGYAFEVNNSCYYTYNNHQQLYENCITTPYIISEDIKHYKLKRCFRFILSFYSRIPEWRHDIKEAMRGDLLKRIECISKIDFHIHNEFPGKKDKIENIYKTFAFQLAQTYSLIHNKELYSKEDVCVEFNQLSKAILRENIDSSTITFMNVLLKELIDYSYKEIYNMKSLDEVLH